MSSEVLVLPRRRALAVWAGAAAALVICSYLFTLLLAAACVTIPFLLIVNFPGLPSLILFISGVVMASVIVWSILPRRDRFTPGGTPLSAADQPRLFAEIQGIAAALNEPMPAEVYLTLDVNAGVADRGGTMGIGSRRIMLLGLPLIRVLTRSELKAVLAHEFAHYYTGDTRLLPWVYKTRGAMIRAIQNLGSQSIAPIFAKLGWASLAYAITMSILGAYWKIFMRISQTMSRRQEYRADEVACHLAGSQSLINGLRVIHTASTAAPWFWKTEMGPAVGAGCRPPIADGFAQFITASQISKMLAGSLDAELRRTTTHPYDTHPTLRDRLAATSAIADNRPADDSPAIALLDNVDSLESQLLKTVNSNLDVAKLTSVTWDRIGPEVYVPLWRRLVAEHASLLPKSIEALPAAVAGIGEIARRIPDPPGMLLTREQRVERAANLVLKWFALALLDSGWALCTKPGEFHFENSGQRIAPAEIINAMRSGQLSESAWREQCRAFGGNSSSASA